MSEQNNVPTAPGWYYRESVTMPESQVYVNDRGSKGLQYCVAGIKGWNDVEDDGLWAGPVPMPSEWVPRDIADGLYREALNVDNTDSELLSRYAALTGIEATP